MSEGVQIIQLYLSLETGAILRFVNYSELPRLNDIIRAIATFNDDQVGSLPEGFIVLKD